VELKPKRDTSPSMDETKEIMKSKDATLFRSERGRPIPVRLDRI
jgi:hypothetical protein